MKYELEKTALEAAEASLFAVPTEGTNRSLVEAILSAYFEALEQPSEANNYQCPICGSRSFT